MRLVFIFGVALCLCWSASAGAHTTPRTIATSIFGYDLVKTSLLSLINRMHWDQLPLKQAYMRLILGRSRRLLRPQHRSSARIKFIFSICFQNQTENSCAEAGVFSKTHVEEQIASYANEGALKMPACTMRPVIYSHMVCYLSCRRLYSVLFSINNDRHVQKQVITFFFSAPLFFPLSQFFSAIINRQHFFNVVLIFEHVFFLSIQKKCCGHKGKLIPCRVRTNEHGKLIKMQSQSYFLFDLNLVTVST